MDTLGTSEGFCYQTAPLWQLVGNFYLVVKILIPVILIIIGIITLGKAVISSDDKEIKKGFTSLFKKIILGVSILFIPIFVSAFLGLCNDFNEVKSDYTVCQKCITKPNSEYCNNRVIAVKEDTLD